MFFCCRLHAVDYSTEHITSDYGSSSLCSIHSGTQAFTHAVN